MERLKTGVRWVVDWENCQHLNTLQELFNVQLQAEKG